jgi:hypothetical protein
MEAFGGVATLATNRCITSAVRASRRRILQERHDDYPPMTNPLSLCQAVTAGRRPPSVVDGFWKLRANVPCPAWKDLLFQTKTAEYTAANVDFVRWGGSCRLGRLAKRPCEVQTVRPLPSSWRVPRVTCVAACKASVQKSIPVSAAEAVDSAHVA